MKELQVIEDMTYDRSEWRNAIRISDAYYGVTPFDTIYVFPFSLLNLPFVFILVF